MTRTFWLSFCDTKKPTGEQFLGVSVVDVTQEMADEALLILILHFPLAGPGSAWPAAAVRQTKVLGCYPGGEVCIEQIGSELASRLPRGQLLQKSELESLAQVSEIES